jgi:hypothetical protein
LGFNGVGAWIRDFPVFGLEKTGVDFTKRLPQRALVVNALWGSACDTRPKPGSCCDKHADTDQLQYWKYNGVRKRSQVKIKIFLGVEK